MCLLNNEAQQNSLVVRVLNQFIHMKVKSYGNNPIHICDSTMQKVFHETYEVSENGLIHINVSLLMPTLPYYHRSAN